MWQFGDSGICDLGIEGFGNLGLRGFEDSGIRGLGDLGNCYLGIWIFWELVIRDIRIRILRNLGI